MGSQHRNTPEAIKYKRYDEALKPSTVEYLLVSGKSVRIITHELSVNEQSLQKWKQRFKALPAGQMANTLEACRRRTAGSNARWCIALILPPAPVVFEWIEIFYKRRGSTAPSVTNPLWTLKPTSIKQL